MQTWSWWALPVQQWLAKCPAVYRVPPCARLLPVFPSHRAVHEESTDDDDEAENSPVSRSSLTASSGSESSPLSLGQSSWATLMLVAPCQINLGWLVWRQGLDCVAQVKLTERWSAVVRMWGRRDLQTPAPVQSMRDSMGSSKSPGLPRPPQEDSFAWRPHKDAPPGLTLEAPLG